jgi:hypothetical protein
MQKFVAATVVGVVSIALSSHALAIPQFQKAFLEKYINDCEDEDFQKMVKREAKCLVCHQGMKSKKHHNAYGVHLTELLTKEDKDDTDKIMKSLEEVANMHSDPEDEESPTYAELIANSKLPGGELAELEKEPEGEEGESK